MNPNAFFIVFSFIVVIGVFFIALLRFLKNKPKSVNSAAFDPKAEIALDYETVMLLLDSRYGTLKDLQKAIEGFFDNYPRWDLNKSQKKNFLFALCLHRHATSKIILEAQKRLTELNPRMEKEFEKVVKKAIDVR